MAAGAIATVTKALEKGFSEKGAKVYVAAEKSDYKDFIRMYVVSDYFRGMGEKDRLGEIFSILESFGAKSVIAKVSLCIAMTKREYEREFGAGTWIGMVGETYREMKGRPKVRRLAKIGSRS